MARYVVLSFDDNKAAEAFVEVEQASYSEFGDRQVIALIAKPTQFHDASCPGTGKRVRGWARGTTFGWWVCSACAKPAAPRLPSEDHRGAEENLMRHVIGSGVNLLKEAANEFADVFDKGWGALGRD